MSRSLRTAFVLFALAISASSLRAGYAPGCTVALALENPLALAHQANAVAIQPDGKIVVAGYADLGAGAGRDFLVARLHPDLSFDTSFNSPKGYLVHSLQNLDDEAFAVVVQFDQKIVVGGYSQDSINKYFFAFARYNRDGSLDTTFAAPSGFTRIDLFPSNNDRLRGMAIQPDGKILGAGFSTPGGTQRLVVVRLQKDGSLDDSFDGNGTALPTIGGSAFSFGTGVVVQPDGKIVVSGEAFGTSSDFIAVRLLPDDGSLDSSFDGDGWVATDIGGGTGDSASSLVLQSDGKIVLAGTTGANAAVARYREDGTLDGTFGSGGKVVHDFGGSDTGNALTLDSGGNLLVAGTSSLNFAFARFLQPDGFNNLSKTDDVSGMEDRAFGIAVTRTGKILVVGSSQGPTPKTTLALYNAFDGKQDCGSFFLHPTGAGSFDFLPVGGCANWDCVNDQLLNAPTGTPVTSDDTATMVLSPSSPAEDLYRLKDGELPPGKVVTEIEIVARLAWSGTGTAPTAELLYQRLGFDLGGPVTGSSVTPGLTFQEVRQRFSRLNWSAVELDALEIGLRHTGGNDLLMTQNYVKVTYGETLVHPVDVFTVGTSGDSTNGLVMLNWLKPSYGLYNRTVIQRATTTCPGTPGEGDTVAILFGGLGEPAGVVDGNLSPGTTYHYTAFVLDSEGRYSTGVCRSATPFDAGVEWRYDTSISALTTPGLRVNRSPDESVVYTVANDGLVHAISGGSVADGGGSWPPNWRPFRIGGPAQARPPVVPLPDPWSTAVLLGSQDGRAYAINAFTGALIWRSAILGESIQAGPAAVLTKLSGTADLVFVATRNTGKPNHIYALDAVDGAVVWDFDNGGDLTRGGNPTMGIGEIVNGASVDYANRRVYFTSALGASGITTWCLNYSVTPPYTTPPVVCGFWPAFGVAPGGGGDIEASPILYQNWLFVSDKSPGYLYKIDLGSGSDSVVDSLGSDGGAKGFVFPRLPTYQNLFASTSTLTYSVDFSIPNVKWSANCVATPSTPTAVNGTDWVFVGSSEGKLFEYSAENGSSTCPTSRSACIGNCTTDPKTIVGAPAYDVLRTMLYVGTDEGKIYGVRAPFQP